MIIRCPECGFERTVDESRLPPSAALATCPRCRHKFRFRDPAGNNPLPQDDTASRETAPSGAPMRPSHPTSDQEAGKQDASGVTPPEREEGDHAPETGMARPDTAARGAHSPEEDDPLPPGAVIPGGTIPPHTADRTPQADGDSETPAPASRPEKHTAKTPDKGDVWDAVSSVGDRWKRLYDVRRQDGGEKPPHSPSDGAQPAGDGVPWEQLDKYGFFPGLYHTILRVMFAAPRFFNQIPADGPSMRPVAFFILLGIFQSLMERLWYITTFNMLGSSIDDPQLHALLGGLAQEFGLGATLMLSPFTLILQLVCVTCAYHFMVRMVQPDKAHFPTMLRVISYSAAPTVVSVVPLLGPTVGSLWFIACTVIGVKHAFKLRWSRVVLALGPLYILAIAAGLQLVKMLMSGGA